MMGVIHVKCRRIGVYAECRYAECRGAVLSHNRKKLACSILFA